MVTPNQTDSEDHLFEESAKIVMALRVLLTLKLMNMLVLIMSGAG